MVTWREIPMRKNLPVGFSLQVPPIPFWPSLNLPDGKATAGGKRGTVI